MRADLENAGKGNGPAAIARALAAEYVIAATTVSGDIDLMLHDLARSGLIAPNL